MALEKAYDGPDREWWEFWVRMPWPAMTAGELYQRFWEWSSFIQFSNLDDLTPEATLVLLREGASASLIGSRESHWLDVKSRPYDFAHDKTHGLEFAQDVTRFANSEEGGLILIGVEERADVITRFRPMTPDPRRAQSYWDRMKDSIYPQVEGLTLETFTIEGGEVTAILIPRQSEHLKPFLVHGAVAGNKVDVTFISVARRRGDKSIFSGVAEVHSWLAAGRAFLRTGGETSEI